MRVKRAVFAAALLLLGAGYAGFVLSTIDALAFAEQTFVTDGGGSVPPVDIYVDVLGVDPVREEIHLRFDVAVGAGRHGRRFFGTSPRDLDVTIGDGDTQRTVAIRRNAPLPSIAFDADVSGQLAAFPFDRYALRLFVSASHPENGGAGELPVRLTVWEGEPGWSLHAASQNTGARELALAFDLRRRAPLIFFACAVYAVMVLIATGALAICATVLLRSRRSPAETLLGALAAMVFALPVLRTNIPGAPPLGVGGDLFVFLWAEVAAAVSLAAVVFVWVRRSERRP